MSAKVEQNLNNGIEQLFAGLVPATDACAFQKSVPSPAPQAAVGRLFLRTDRVVAPPPTLTQTLVRTVMPTHFRQPRQVFSEAIQTKNRKTWTYRGLTRISANSPKHGRRPNRINGESLDSREPSPQIEENATIEAPSKPATACMQEEESWERSPKPRSRENYELARVVQAWGNMPPNIRNAILAIIDSL